MACCLHVLCPRLSSLWSIYDFVLSIDWWWSCYRDLGVGYRLLHYALRRRISRRDHLSLPYGWRGLLSNFHAVTPKLSETHRLDLWLVLYARHHHNYTRR